MARVLVVDDEDNVRELLRRWIVAGGDYEVDEAEDAEVALKRMAACPADAVFCDVQMPGHDGLWLTKELRARYPTTAVILATGVSTVPPNVSMQAGVLAYLVKPFRREPLMNALVQALEWHKETVASGAKPEDVGAALTDWLDQLKDF